MPAAKRVDEYTIEVGVQADIETAAVSLTAGDILPPDVSSIGRGEVEDPTTTIAGGARPTIPGVYYDEIAAPASMHARGQGSAVTGAPTLTAQDILVGACFQQAPDEMSGSTAEAGASVSAVSEADIGNHAPTAILGIPNSVVLAPFFVTSLGRTFLRPATYSGGDFSLLVDLPGAPAEDDPIYGQANVQFNHNTFDSIPYPVEARYLGNAQIQNKQLIGAVAQLAIPEVSAGDVPQMDFTLQAGLGVLNLSDSRAAPTPRRGRVFAGGELKLGVFGSAPSDICGTFSASFREGGFVPNTCPGKTYTIGGSTYDTGIDDWTPPKEAVMCQLTVPESVVPSDLTGGSGATWDEAWADYPTQRYHLLFTCGQGRAGSLVGLYYPDMILAMKPERGATKDEVGARTLTFKHYDSSSYAPCIYAGS